MTRATRSPPSPELLDSLLIRGYLVSIDAMGCQSQIAAKILAQKADYLLAVKGNQPSLQVTLEGASASPSARHCSRPGNTPASLRKPMAASCGGSSGGLPTLAKWMLNTGQECKMLGHRSNHEIVGDKASAPERRYYIASRRQAIDFAKAVRAHWGIENGVPGCWTSIREDAATVRKDYARGQPLPAEAHRSQSGPRPKPPPKPSLERSACA